MRRPDRHVGLSDTGGHVSDTDRGHAGGVRAEIRGHSARAGEKIVGMRKTATRAPLVFRTPDPFCVATFDRRSFSYLHASTKIPLFLEALVFPMLKETGPLLRSSLFFSSSFYLSQPPYLLPPNHPTYIYSFPPKPTNSPKKHCQNTEIPPPKHGPCGLIRPPPPLTPSHQPYPQNRIKTPKNHPKSPPKTRPKTGPRR